MAKFKHKNGGICEVFSLDNINKLKKDKNYIEISEKKPIIRAKEQFEKSIINAEKNQEGAK